MNLGLFTLYHPFIAFASLVLTFILVIYTFTLHRKLRTFISGKDARSLEEVIASCVSGIEDIQKKNEIISEHALKLDDRVGTALRNAQMIRYKAFEINGSNQSFSIALLNEKGNGVVISSLHHHDRVSTFAKPIEKYESTYDLTDEELDVIKKSKDEHRQSKKAFD